MIEFSFKTMLDVKHQDRSLTAEELTALADWVLGEMNAEQTEAWLRHSPYRKIVADALAKSGEAEE